MKDVNAAIDDNNMMGDQIAVYYCSGKHRQHSYS